MPASHSSCFRRARTARALFVAVVGAVVCASPMAWAVAQGELPPGTSEVTVALEETGAPSELGPAPGIFRLTRTGDTSQPLVVGFTLGGTATQGSDYLLWETSARFEAGADTARVTVMPRNDALQEGGETVALTLEQGQGYTVGTPGSATVTVADAFLQGFPGVFEQREIDPQTGRKWITPDLVYLDASVDAQAGALVIQVGVDAPGAFSNVVLYLDADQDPATGDYRAGHVAGQEYRLEAFAGLISDYRLYRLRTVPPLPTGPEKPEDDHFVLRSGASTSNGLLTLSVPLEAIGNPTAVDVFAITHLGEGNIVTQGIGDRAPDFGALDTRSHQVVVRRPAATRYLRLGDPPGDAVNGFDLVSAELATVADQFFLTLGFSQFFDPSRPTLFPGPTGEVQLDSDRSLLTGGFPLGGPIATWGGDVQLFYSMGGFQGIRLLVQTDSLGNQVAFGQNKNDGRWLAQGGRLFLSSSLSIHDVVQHVFDTLGNIVQTRRVPVDGHMYARLSTLSGNLRDIADAIPGAESMVDTASGTILQPFSWDPGSIVRASDPLEFPQPLSGVDLTGIEAQIIQDHLVIKGLLGTWLQTDTGNIFHVLLDTDEDAGTAPRGVVANPQGTGTAIGADYELVINSVDSGGAPVYLAGLATPNGTVTRTDGLVRVQTTSILGQPGSFTVTLPLEAIGRPSRPRLYVTTGRFEVGGLDIAPPDPMLLDTGGAPTPRPRP